MRRLISTIVCILFGVAAPGPAAFAQEGGSPVAHATNAGEMGALAAECALSTVPGPGPIRVTGVDDIPFVRSAVFTALRARGFTVYEPGATAPGLTKVDLAVEVLSVAYGRADRDRVTRRVEVRLHAFVTDPDGAVLRDEACTRSSETLVERSAVPDFEDASDPRTRAVLPPAGGFLRRVVQPAVIAAATAAGVFLFFSLRSRRTGTGE